MSGRRGVGVIVVPSLFVLLLALAALPSAAKPPVAQQTVAVRLIQLDWLRREEPAIECSRVFEVQVMLRGSDRQLLEANGGGWVNVVLDIIDPETNLPYWAVRNLFLSYPDVPYMVKSRPTAQFGLPWPFPVGGNCVTSMGAAVVVTPEPVLEPSWPPPLVPTVVEREGHLVGGIIGIDEDGNEFGGGSENADVPFMLGPWELPPPAAGPPPGVRPQSTWSPTPWRGILDVSELNYGCAPAAATRSIKTVMKNERKKTEPAVNMYNHLIDDMKTKITPGPGEVGGTKAENMNAGKNQYCYDHDLPINSEMQWGEDSFAAASEVLGRGGDVELWIGWTGTDGRPNGGHAAMVTGMKQVAPHIWQITYVDDPVQGDGVAASKEHVIVVSDLNGYFTRGKVWGFMLEEVEHF